MPADFAVIIPAAGQSLRYAAGGDARSKLAEQLRGRSVLEWSAAAFLARADVAEVVIAASDIPAARELVASLLPDPRLRFVLGGSNRAESVRAALLATSPSIPFVAVHDGARPAVTQDLVDRVFSATRAHGAAGPALPVDVTIKQVASPPSGRVHRDAPCALPTLLTLPRHSLRAMQTPQAMRRADLLAAFAACPIPLAEVTDDLQLLELAGLPATLVDGDPANLKITRRSDLAHVFA